MVTRNTFQPGFVTKGMAFRSDSWVYIGIVIAVMDRERVIWGNMNAF